MKRLFLILKDFVQQDFHFRTYLLILLWATLLLAINFSLELEDDIIDSLPTNGLRFLGYLSLYTISYYTALYITLARLPLAERKNILTRKFWFVSLLGISIYAADAGFVWHENLLDMFSFNGRLHGYYFAVLSNSMEFITIALPLFIVNWLLIPNRIDNLGINRKEMELAPFFVLLLLIAPFIFLSAYEKGLNNYYPTFRYGSAAHVLEVPAWVPVSVYEMFYGLDFFNVELMFRGFMVVGMAAILGRHALLPMAVFYCSIHFGKPLLEAVSSLFGGYILGAIAIQTRAIWGGVIVHMGLAWLMELSAFTVKTLIQNQES